MADYIQVRFWAGVAGRGAMPGGTDDTKNTTPEYSVVRIVPKYENWRFRTAPPVGYHCLGLGSQPDTMITRDKAAL